MKKTFKGKVMGIPENIDEMEAELKLETKEMVNGYVRGLDKNSIGHMFKQEQNQSGYNKTMEMTNSKSNNFRYKNKIDNIFAKPKQNKKINVNNYFKSSNSKKSNFNFKNLISGMQTEKIARRRIKQQQYLSPLGDYDGDKLPNMLDCDPMDYFKQGSQHGTAVQDILKGSLPASESLRYQSDNPNVIPETKYRDIQTGKYTKAPLEINIESNEPDKIQESQNSMPTNKIGFLQKIGQVTGLSQALNKVQEQKTYDESIRQQARTKALEQLEKQKAENIFKEELFSLQQRKKSEGLIPLKQIRDETQQGLSSFGKDLSAGFGMYGGADASKIRDITGTQGRLNVGFRTSGESFAMKVDELIGRGKMKQQIPISESQEQPIQIIEQQSQQPRIYFKDQQSIDIPEQYQQYEQPEKMTMSVQQVEKKIISPYSKRPVTYTRGPYKKRI